MAAFLLGMALAGNAVGDVPVDPVGNYLGCDTDPAASPYCTDPELRALFHEQNLLGAELQGLAKVEIGSSGSLPGWMVLRQVRNSLALDMRRCNGDRNCLLTEMEQRAVALRLAAGRPPDTPLVTPKEATELDAAGDADAERLRAAAREIAEAYPVEWEKTRALLAPPDDPDFVEPLFAWRNPAPEVWASKRERNCRGDLACLADRTDLDRLLGVQREAEAARAAAVARAAEEERERAVAEERRIAAERRLAEQRAAFVERLERYNIDGLLPEGSKLRPILFGRFATFDRQTALPLAKEVADGFRGAVALFGGEYMASTLDSRARDNRRNLVLAAYGLTRKEVLGYCGDRKVQVYRRSTPGSELRTLGGITIQRQEGVDIYTEVPAPFARFVKGAHFESGTDHFRAEISRFGSCDHPVRRVLEHNLIAYATGGQAIPWDPKNTEMYRLLR